MDDSKEFMELVNSEKFYGNHITDANGSRINPRLVRETLDNCSVKPNRARLSMEQYGAYENSGLGVTMVITNKCIQPGINVFADLGKGTGTVPCTLGGIPVDVKLDHNPHIIDFLYHGVIVAQIINLA